MSEEYKNYGSDLFLDCNDRCRDINEVKEELKDSLKDLNAELSYFRGNLYFGVKVLTELIGALIKREDELIEADELAEEVEFIRDEIAILSETIQLLNKRQTETNASLERRRIYIGESDE